MKITAIENFLVDKGGPAPWLFCAIRTDSGITGYSEYGQGPLYKGLPGLIEDLGRSLIGQDPRPVDKGLVDRYRSRRAETGGATAMAMAGIELALWDIKGKDLGVPVYRMVGGPFREKQRVYWSHLATYLVRRAEQLGKPPLRTMEDIADCAREAVDAGYTAVKTNIIFPGESPSLLNHLFAGADDQTAQQGYKERADGFVTLEIGEYRLRIENYPTDLKLKFGLGKLFFEQGEHEDAIAMFQESQNESRHRVASRSFLGRSFLAIGWIDEAVQTLRDAMDVHKVHSDDTGLELRYFLLTALQMKAEQGRTNGRLYPRPVS